MAQTAVLTFLFYSFDDSRMLSAGERGSAGSKYVTVGCHAVRAGCAHECECKSRCWRVVGRSESAAQLAAPISACFDM